MAENYERGGRDYKSRMFENSVRGGMILSKRWLKIMNNPRLLNVNFLTLFKESKFMVFS